MHDFVGQFPVLAAFSERTEKQRNASICILSKERVHNQQVPLREPAPSPKRTLYEQ
jgi:hypothetical protein